MNHLGVFVVLAVSHLTSRPLRTALTVVGVGIGVAATLGMSLANRTIFEAFQQSVTQVVGEATIHLAGAERRLDERLLERIRSHPGVHSVHPFIVQAVTLETEDGVARSSLMWGLDFVALADEEGWPGGRETAESAGADETGPRGSPGSAGADGSDGASGARGSAGSPGAGNSARVPGAGETARASGAGAREPGAGDSSRAPDAGNSGEWVPDDLLDDRAMVVGRELAAGLGVSRGDRVTVRVGGRRFEATVRGVWRSSARAGRWGGFAAMDMAAAQVRLGRLGRLDGVDVVTAHGASVELVMRELQDRLGPAVLVGRSAQRNETVRQMLTSFQLNLTALSVVGLCVGMFLVYNAVGFSVVQYRREIGMLRAIGMRRWQIGLVFLGEAALVGAAGGVLGAVFGSGLAHYLVALEAETVSELYGMAAPGVPAFSVRWVAGGGLLGVGLSVAGAWGPCREASRTAPARALAPGQDDAHHRAHGPPVRWAAAAAAALGAAWLLSLPGPVNDLPLFGYAAAFCVLLGCALLAPLGLYLLGVVTAACVPASSGTRLAVDRLTASPGRTSVTLSALMVALAIVVGVGVMVASFRDAVERWIDQTFMADFIVAPHAELLDPHHFETAPGLSPDVIRRAGAVPGVAAVDPYRQTRLRVSTATTKSAARAVDHDRRARLRVGDAQVWLVARDLEIHAARSRYLFVRGESARLLRRAIAERGVVISEVLARRLRAGVGDVLELPTAVGRRAVTVVGVFYDYATDGGKVVLDRSLYREWWGDETATVLGIYLAPEASPSRVRRDLRQALASARVAVVGNHALRVDVLAVFDRTFRLTHGLEGVAVIVGVLAIMNTLLTMALERRREVATLRALGASRGQVRGLVVRESLCLGLVGLGLGVFGGVLLAALLIGVINTQSFGWSVPMRMPAHPILSAVLIAGVTSLVAGYLPARWATRGEIAEGLRYE